MIFNMQLSEDASLAELSDIRVGVDGTVYPSAGDAVRGQITDVKEDIDEFKSEFSGESEYSNLFNKKTVIYDADVNSSTGAVVPHSNTFVSDYIKINAAQSLSLKGGLGAYYYVYDSSYNYLGYVQKASNNRTIIGNTYPLAQYVRVYGNTSNINNNCMLLYTAHNTDTFVPYNIIDGNLARSRFLSELIISNRRIVFGLLWRNGYININTTATPITYKLVTNYGYIITSDGRAIQHGIQLNTEIALGGSSGINANSYWTLVYDIENHIITGVQDYTGDYSKYVVLGYYEYGKIYGNMGVVTINNAVANEEIDKALADYDIGDLSELEQKVDNNSTNIGVNAAAISSEASTRAAADLALGARIDNLTAPTGESVAEITDARVGYNGTIYASLEARLNAEAGRVRNVLVVGTGGQYQTIAAAVSAAQNGDIIFIKRGVYEEHVLNRDKELHIIGESKEEVIWKHENTDYGDDDCYDCGMGSIRNLTMWNYDNGGTPSGQYGRSYCVHLDHQSYYQQHPPISNYFYCENVHFINDSNECLGLGLRNNMIMEFVNCDVETLSGNEAAFYVHAASATSAKCLIKSCTISNNSSVGQLGALRVEGYNHTVKGCTLVLERDIAINYGTGPAVVWQLSKVNKSSWRDIPDWDLDKCSLLNTDGLNYTEA